MDKATAADVGTPQALASADDAAVIFAAAMPCASKSLGANRRLFRSGLIDWGAGCPFGRGFGASGRRFPDKNSTSVAVGLRGMFADAFVRFRRRVPNATFRTTALRAGRDSNGAKACDNNLLLAIKT